MGFFSLVESDFLFRRLSSVAVFFFAKSDVGVDRVVWSDSACVMMLVCFSQNIRMFKRDFLLWLLLSWLEMKLLAAFCLFFSFLQHR